MWQPCEVGNCATLSDTKACDKKLDITINVVQMVTRLLKSMDTPNALLLIHFLTNQGEALYCPL
jgi:hypothetical protein